MWDLQTQKNATPKSGAPKGGEPKISLFSLSRRHFALFVSLSLGAFSWNFGGFLKRRGLKCARLESPNGHILRSRPSKNPPKFHEEDNEMGAGEGKKSEIFRRFGGGWFGAGFQTNNNHNKHNHNNTNSGPNPEEVWGPPRIFGQNTKTLKLAKVGLAKVGHDHEQMVQRMN